MDNATRRQLLEQAKQVGYTGSILDVFQNPQVLDQFAQEQQVQQPQQPQQPQQQMPVEMPTPPATTPNYKVAQPRQSEAKPLVMSNMEVPIQIRRNGGLKFDDGGPLPKVDPNTNPNQDLTYKDNPEWFDNRAIYSGNDKYDAQIRKVIYDGKGSYNPATRTLTRFTNPNQQYKVDETTKAYSKDKRTQTAEDKKLIAKDAAKQHVLNEHEDFVQKSALAAGVLAAPLVLPSAGAITAAMDAPLVVGGTTVSGVTLGGTIGAAGAGYGLTRIPETGETIKTAYNNPTTSNITNAAIATGENTLDFVGLGLMKETMPVLKSGVKTAKQLLDAAKESKYVEALNPFALKNINNIRLRTVDDLSRIPEETNTLYDNNQNLTRELYKIDKYLRRKPINIENIEKVNYKADKYDYILGKTKGYKIKGEDVVGEIKEFEPVLNTENSTIVDFNTGNIIKTDVKIPSKTRTINIKDGNLNEELVTVGNAEVNPEYTKAVNNNIEFIEKTVPGAKVFGSSKGVGEVGLPHVSHDYDVFISQKNYDNYVNNKLDFIGNIGPAKTHTIGKQFGEQGWVDFNIINADANGKATGERAVELFRQFFPDEFYAASKKAAALENGQIKIPYTPDELIAKVDPSVKTIIDAYESTKPKHINRIDAYIHFGDPKIVAKAQEHFVKSLVGSKGKIGPQYTDSQLSNFDENLKILEEIKFIGDPTAVAKNPQKMQVALNDFYINKTVLNRQVNKQFSLNSSQQIENSFKYWKSGGGSANGWGLNHVQLGDSGWATIIGNKQLGIKHYNTPLENVMAIKTQTEGAPLTANDVNTIKSILSKHFDPSSPIHKAAEGMQNSKDLIQLPVDPNQDMQAMQNAYNEITKTLGYKAVTNDAAFGNSMYASTLGDFDETEDALAYAHRQIMPVIKSYSTRSSNFKGIQGDQANLDFELSKKGFKTFKGYLNYGEENIRKKLYETNAELDKLSESRKELAERMLNTNPSKKEQLEYFKKEQKRLTQKDIELSDKIQMLDQKSRQIKNLQESYKILGVGGVTLPLSYYAMFDPKAIEDLFKFDNGSGKRKPKEKNKISEVKTNEKKYGGKKCYTCNSSNLQVLYNKRNYKK